jgi:DNA-binding response OmpR family regulator
MRLSRYDNPYKCVSLAALDASVRREPIALEAADGGLALRVLESSQRVDLLVTDIGLPDINGRQVADAARAKRPNLKVLFMTGYAERAASSEFLDKGMEIIGKPFTMDKLAIKIREMIERRADTATAEPPTR